MARRLLTAMSPYLRQHATNAIDWHEWGPVAFASARERNVPLLVSVGYSSCRWCHVMEREVFEPPASQQLNEYFVAIKVDRETRPDVDEMLMSFCVQTNGSGGWPLNVFMTPTTPPTPLVAVTYMPLLRFTALAQAVHRKWRTDPNEVLERGRDIVAALRQSSVHAESTSNSLPASSAALFFDQILSRFDTVNGGLKGSPKFPQSTMLVAAIELSTKTATPPATATATATATGTATATATTTTTTTTTTIDGYQFALRTVLSMANGGIYDHLGGGWHRYTVDDAWRVPHFEKMLYDNAQMMTAIAALIRCSPDGANRRRLCAIGRHTAAYVVAELRDDTTGALYCAEDAESNVRDTDGAVRQGVEGGYYVWSATELDAALRAVGVDDASVRARFADYYDVKAHGNVPVGADPHHDFINVNTLVVKAFDADTDAVINDARRALAAWRSSNRSHPFKDQKCVAAWAALGVSGLARLGFALGDWSLIDAATHSARFIFNRLSTVHSDGSLRLTRALLLDDTGGGTGTGTGSDAQSGVAFADDYAFVVSAFLDVATVTGDDVWRDRARALHAVMDAEFWSESMQTYTTASQREADVEVAVNMASDAGGSGSMPSVVAVAIANALRLAHSVDSSGTGTVAGTVTDTGTGAAIDSDIEWLRRATTIVNRQRQYLNQAPMAVPDLTAVVERLRQHATATTSEAIGVEIVGGSRGDASTESMIDVVRRNDNIRFDNITLRLGRSEAAFAVVCNSVTKQCGAKCGDAETLRVAIEKAIDQRVF